MGKSKSGGGGGSRDNRHWGEGNTDGFMGHTDPEKLQEQVGNTSWENRLTDDQKHALDMYLNRDNAYRDINNALRKGQDASPETQKLIDNLGAALDDSYLKQNITVTRRSGASLLGGADTPAKIREMYGKVVVDPGFASSTAKVDSGAYANTRPMEYHIKVPGRTRGVGAYVQDLATFEEHEFLFNRGSAFRILGSYSRGGKTHVNMEYVGRR